MVLFDGIRKVCRLVKGKKRPKTAEKCCFVQEALKNNVGRGMVKMSWKATKK